MTKKMSRVQQGIEAIESGERLSVNAFATLVNLIATEPDSDETAKLENLLLNLTYKPMSNGEINRWASDLDFETKEYEDDIERNKTFPRFAAFRPYVRTAVAFKGKSSSFDTVVRYFSEKYNMRELRQVGRYNYEAKAWETVEVE